MVVDIFGISVDFVIKIEERLFWLDGDFEFYIIWWNYRFINDEFWLELIFLKS